MNKSKLCLFSFILLSTLTAAQSGYQMQQASRYSQNKSSVSANNNKHKNENYTFFKPERTYNLEKTKKLIPPEYWEHPDFGKLPATASCNNCFEEIHKRTRNERFYRNIDDPSVFYNEVSYNRSNFLKDGFWRAVDTRLTKINDNLYSAPQQPFPTEINTKEKHTAITVEGKRFEFNNIEIIEISSANEIKSIPADWSDFTIGENGTHIKNIYPGIDVILKFGNGSVKSEFILKKRISELNKLILRDKLLLPEGFMLKNERDGKIAITDSKGEEFLSFGQILISDNSSNRNKFSDGIYEINSNARFIDILLSSEILNNEKAVYPINIDPLVSSSGTRAQGTISGSGLNNSGSWVGFCSYTLTANKPANSTITDILWSFTYGAQNGAIKDEGAVVLLYSSCRSPDDPSLYWTCQDGFPGQCTGTSISIYSDFISCIPAPACSGTMPFTMEFYDAWGGGSCDNTYISADSDWIMTIEGRTMEQGSPPSSSAGTTICSGTSTTLTATGQYGVPGYSYSWSSGQSGNPISVSPSSNTTYTCTITDACGQTASNSVTINVNQPSIAPSSITASPNPVCNGTSVTLTQNGGTLGTSAAYQWYSGGCPGTFLGNGTSIAVTPSSTTTYFVRASGTCNTTSCAQITVTVGTNSTAPSSITASPNPVCSGNSVTLTQSGGTLGTNAQYNWYSTGCGSGLIGSGNSISVNPSSTTTYYVLASGDCNTTSCAQVTINISSFSTAPSSITASANPVCSGNSVTLTQSGGALGTNAQYNWYSTSCGSGFVGSGNSISVNPSSTTTYFVLASGDCNTTSCASITINTSASSIAPSSITASANPVCAGTSVTLTQNGGTLGTNAQYNWYSTGCGSGLIGSGNSISANPASTTTYFVLASGDCNTTSCASVTVNVSSNSTAPSSITTSANPVCSGTAVTLTQNGGTLGTNASYNWYSTSCGSGSAGSGNSISVSPSSTTTYFVLASGDCNTTSCAQVALTVNQYPDATITPVGAACPGDPPITLSVATGGGTFSATCGGCVSGNSFDPSVAGTGAHTVTYTITVNGCTSTDTEIINVNSSADATINSVPDKCTSDPPFNFTAATGGGTWSGTGITNSANGTFDPAIAGGGTYTITYTIGGGCGGTDTETINVTANPDATITPVGALCPSDPPQTLTPATAGGTFSGTGVSGNTFDPTVSGVGTFTITYDITVNGCSSSDTETITVNSSSDPTITAVSPMCTNDASITLSVATGGGTFSATCGSCVSGNSFDPAIAGAGTHTVTYTIGGSCGGTDTEDIVVTANPDATINAAPSFCTGDAPYNLTSITSGGIWSGPGITDASNGTFNPSIAGQGTFTVTYDVTVNGCSSSDTEIITVNSSSDPTITATAPMCANDAPITLNVATGGGTFSATCGSCVSGNSFDPAIAGAGTHTVTYTIGGSCGGTDTEDIIVTASPDATINPAGPFCTADPPVNLTSITSGGNWTGTGITDASNGTFNPSLSGIGTFPITYDVTVNGCSSSDIDTITVNDNLDPTINAVAPVCSGDSPFDLSAATPGGIWSGTAITNSSNGTFDPSVANIGNNTVTYTTPGSCGGADTEDIVVNQSADAAINPMATTLCTADSPVPLSALNPGGTWSSSAPSAIVGTSFNPSIAGVGTHTIKYTISGTCGDSDSVSVTVIQSADATVNPVSPLCTNDSPAPLSAVDTGGIWSGSSGIVGTSFNPAIAGAGTHTVIYTISGACGDIDSIQITVNQSADATINTAGPYCEMEDTLFLSALQSGGTWFGIGITDTTLGIFDPSVPTPGIPVTITYNIGGACPDSKTIQITVNPKLDAAIVSDSILCTSDLNDTLTAVNSTLSDIWQITDMFGNPVANLNPALPVYNPASLSPGNYSVLHIITNQGLCGDTATLNLTIIKTPDATILGPYDFCNNSDTVNLSAVDTNNFDSWTGLGIIDLATGLYDPSAASINPPNYDTVTHYIADPTGKCSNFDTIVIFVNKIPPPPVVVSDTVCIDDVITLFASDTSIIGTGVLNWYYDSAGTITLAPNGVNVTSYNPANFISDSVADSVYVFFVQEQNGNCPSNPAPVFVKVINIDASFATTPADSGEIPLNVVFNNTSFIIDTLDNFLWTFGDDDSSKLFSPTHIYNEIGDYTITLMVKDKFDVCQSVFTYKIHAKGTSSVEVPNIFTPNGDGRNDVFNVIYKNLIEAEGTIYNRWGELIFKWGSVDSGWDGRTLSGTFAPDGVYYYLITATGTDEPEPKKYEFRGSVTLAR